MKDASDGRRLLAEVAAEAGYDKSHLVEEAVRARPPNRFVLVACSEDD